ncbi:exo-alpha-sialidase [Spirosoma sp. HMF4905]|uniref:Exo-alpha-sialidase n=1 Tax=Spirosoma arboris TaxID=2682092 RepID=A0A7K1SBD1_9BACT|nr:exo-alpha-sialidase [Spirosoma arboris]MVM31081.1 exo-alpha-sialidase [Spirosoma arboris]
MNSYGLALLLLCQLSFALDKALEFPKSFPHPDSQQIQKRGKPAAANIVFKSTDGGQTWQDISEGLPEGAQAEDIIEKDRELYIRAGNEIYHGKPTSTAPFWQKESFPNEHRSNVWSPTYTNFQHKGVNTVFETAGGTVFIGCNNGLFKSTTNGETWKQVHTGGWVMKLVESNGVLMATSQSGILRSTDDGENWDLVIREGGVGIAVERIKGGFAAITYNTESMTRRVRTSYDGGKIWQSIDAGLPATASIASIIQVGEYFFCGHPDGIFRSSDQGKTWKLLLPSIENKVFNLSVSGNAIYAIPRDGGC